MVRYLKIVNPHGYESLDVLGEIKGNYEALYSLDLNSGKFSNQATFERFITYMQRATGLKILSLWRVKLE